MVALEKKLVNAVILIEQAQRGFQAFCQRVDRRLVQTLVVDALHFKNDARVTGLRQEHLRAGKAKEVDHGIE